jgi:hypothetical protein
MAKRKPEPKTYHVSGPNSVLEHEPGETFEAILEPIVEERLIQSGNLAAGPAVATTDKTDADDGAERSD